MSNSSLQPDPDALRESAIAVITYVRDAMNDGVALLKEHNRLLVENQGEHRLESEIQAINENLRHVNDNLERVKRSELTMTIVAPTSAGKSTIINAIAGQDLLPSRNDAMTVLPTEIVFSREVTRPKLTLGKALMTLLREAWRQLHQKFQRIGLDEAIKQAAKNDFARKNVIKEIFNSSVFPLSEEVKPDDIQSALIKINDLLRLCGILGISTEFLSSLSEIPRIEVPFPPELSSLEDLGLGTLVLVDTTGPSEDKSLNLAKVVEDRLKKSSLILVVVDSEKVGQTDPVKVKKLVDKIAADKGRDRISIIVNRIDTRKKGDLTTEETLNLVQTQYEITKDRIFETSALRAFLATNFRRERRILEPTELRESESFNSLGEAYYGDSWEDRKENIFLSEMDNASDKYWQKSGFADFTKKAITPLVKGAAPPSMITIKETLNDITQRFADFLSCLSKRKGILERDIQQLEIEINQLEIDLEEVRVTYKDDGWKKYITESLMQKFGEEILPFIEAQKNISLKAIEYHMNILWKDLIEIAQESLGLDRNGCVYVNMSMIRKIEKFLVVVCVTMEEDYSLITEKFNIQNFISKANDDLNDYHKSVLMKAKRRLGKDFSWNLQPNRDLIILQGTLEGEQETLKAHVQSIFLYNKDHLFDSTSGYLSEMDYYKETQVGKVTLYILYLKDTRRFFWDTYHGQSLDLNYKINQYIHLPILNRSQGLYTFPIGYKVEVDTTNTNPPVNNIEIAYACEGTWVGLSNSQSSKSHSYYVTKETIYKTINYLFNSVVLEQGIYILSRGIRQLLFGYANIIFQQEKIFLKEYENDLQRSLNTNKETLKQYLPLEKEYIQFLGKTANLEKDLKYQQEYFKQH